MWTKSTSHLAEAGESYFEHLRFASGVGLMLVAAGLACIIHAIVPAFCTKTASRTVDELRCLFAERHTFATVLKEASGALTLVGLVALTLPAWALLLLAPNYPVPVATALFALAIPATYLWSNPQLEPVD